MNSKIAKTVLVCTAFMAVLVGLLVYRVVNPGALDREQLNQNGLFLYDTPRSFTDIELVDQNGEAFTEQDLEGQWTLVFFGYTFCPDICPITLATLSQFMDLLEQDTDYAEDTEVLMVSVDPRRDTPERLKEYVSYFNEDFDAVVGEYPALFNFARQLNVAFNYLPGETEEEYLVSHSGEILVINPEGDFHGIFKVPHEPERMKENFEAMRREWERNR